MDDRTMDILSTSKAVLICADVSIVTLKEKQKGGKVL
jgi:hypothetical protein